MSTLNKVLIIIIYYRIFQINISGNPETSIIINYAPINGIEEAENHYEKLNEVIHPKTQHDSKSWSFNAHLGK